MQNLTKQTLAGFKWTYVSVAFQAILQLTILSTLARLLTPEEFGIVGLALIFTTFVERVGFLGVGPALVQRETLSETIEGTARTISVLLGLGIFASLYFAAEFVAAFFSEPRLINVLQVISLTFLIESFATISENMLQRELRFKALLVSNNLSYFLGQGVCGITLAYLGFGVWSLVFASITTRFIRACVLIYHVPLKFIWRPDPTELKELLHIGFGFSLSRLLNYFALQGDNFMIGRLLGTTALGFYGRAYQLMTLPATYFGQILEKVLFPAMSKRQNNRKQLATVFLLGIEASALIGIPTSTFLCVATEEVVLVLFGNQWGAVVPILRILALGVFFRTCYKNSDTLIRALGAVYKLSFLQAIYAALVIGGAIIGARWGLEGVGFAVLFAVMINHFLLSRLSLRMLDISWGTFWRAHLGPLWCSLAILLVLYPLLQYLRNIEMNHFVRLAIAVATSSTVMIAALLISPSSCRLTLSGWIVNKVNLERFGKVGCLAQSFFVRISAA